jgi:hypothetical protein
MAYVHISIYDEAPGVNRIESVNTYGAPDVYNSLSNYYREHIDLGVREPPLREHLSRGLTVSLMSAFYVFTQFFKISQVLEASLMEGSG